MHYELSVLRAIRKETQEDVAKVAGVTVQTYNAWEKDISNVSLSKANRLARHFGITLDDLFFANRHANNATYKETED
ncbi:helix-turn-helix protein [anaerobic digester metagenome]